MNKPVMKTVSLCLCGTLALGGLWGAVRAADNTPEPAPQPVSAETGEISAPAAAEKDETVYVLMGADGTVEQIIVSDWLKNRQGSPLLADPSGLAGVENIKGSETYTVSGDTQVWEANGRDIYSQGTSDRDLPVELTVRCTLDGQEIAPQALAGKSGKVTIRFDYTNRAYEMMDVGGKQEKVYVPFVLVTGMALDNDVFRNVEVTHGRLVNDGDRSAVIGVALPGLQENLDIEREELEIPDYLEITADVTNFEMGTTFTVASANLLDGLDLEKLDAGELSGSLEQLTDAMEQLLDGSGRLYDGLCTLLDSSGQLVGGIDRLAAGTGALQDGAGSLTAGASQLQEGASALRTGLDTLNGSSDSLNAGAGQVFDTLLASAQAQLTAAGVKTPELTKENYAQVLEGVIASLPEGASGPVQQLKASLDSYNTFYQGLQSYTAGVAEAAAGAGSLETGAGALQAGAAQLSGGAAELHSGVQSLQAGAPALVDGITQLRDGALALNDGLEEFNREGVQKIVDAFDGDLERLSERLRATADAAERYRCFSGVSPETDSQVRFIYRTASVKP